MFASGDKWIEIRCDALRREPRFELVSATSYRDKNEKTRELLRCLPRPMVVYVMRPDQAEKAKEMAADIGITNVETSEVVKIHEQGAKRRQDAEMELVKVEQELKQALLEAGSK